ncbi:MAG: biotin transporter BioY [Actinomycetaceae bacterium]|nr:biotin transporter BioY [Actinomycetaceae bacterium]
MSSNRGTDSGIGSGSDAGLRVKKPLGAVLVETIPGARVRDVLVVLFGTLALIVLGQVSLPLPFTPVPLSLGTFVVLLLGVSAGPLRAGLSVALYMGLGLSGVGVFASGASGWAFASFGYILGYGGAVVVMGLMARRMRTSSVLATFGMCVVGNAVIYAGGVPWLMAFLGVDFAAALGMGVLPFLLGDAIKCAMVTALVPTAWHLSNRLHSK